MSDSNGLNGPRLIAVGGGQNLVAGRDVNYTLVHNYLKLRGTAISQDDFKVASSDLFVAPSGYSVSLRETLEEFGLLIVLGPPDHGKRTLGIRILQECLEATVGIGGIRSRIVEVEMGWQELQQTTVPADRPTGYFYDLTKGDDELPSPEFADELVSEGKRLRARGSFIIVAATKEIWTSFGLDSGASTCEVGRQDAKVIANRRIRHSELQTRVAWLDDSRISALRVSLPRDAVRLAEAVLSAPGSLPEDAAIAWVVDRMRNWNSYIRNWFKDNESVTDRATILALAALEPGSPTEVIDARDRLMRLLGYEVEEYGPLAGLGLTGHLAKAGAERRDGLYSISEERPGLGDAVLDFAWDEWPKLRPLFRDWLIALAVAGGEDLIARVANISVGMALRRGSAAFLELVRQIARGGKSHIELGVAIVDRTALDPVVGRKVRRNLLRWANEDNAELGVIAGRVCGRTFGRERPLLALRRICAILSRSDNAEAVRAAEASLTHLVLDPDLRYEILSTLIGWTRRSDSRAGILGFLALMREPTGAVVRRLFDDSQTGLPASELMREGWLASTSDSQYRVGVVEALDVFLDGIDRHRISQRAVIDVVLPAIRESMQPSLIARLIGSDVPDDSIQMCIVKELVYGRLNPDSRMLEEGRLE